MLHFDDLVRNALLLVVAVTWIAGKIRAHPVVIVCVIGLIVFLRYLSRLRLSAVVLIEAYLLSQQLLKVELHHKLLVDCLVACGMVTLRLGLDVADGAQLAQRLFKALAIDEIGVKIDELVEALLHWLNLQNLLLWSIHVTFVSPLGLEMLVARDYVVLVPYIRIVADVVNIVGTGVARDARLTVISRNRSHAHVETLRVREVVKC